MKNSRRTKGKKKPLTVSTSKLKAQVVSRFGNEADIRLDNNNIVRCHIRRSLSHLVCGDRVQVHPEDTHHVIDKIEQRETLLERPVPYEGLKPVAANFDLLVIVCAVLPEFSPELLDRYLAMANAVRVDALIVINKVDLLSPEEEQVLIKRTACYRQLNYPLTYCSVKNRQGVDDIADFIAKKTCIFVGQSGVGKSSLLNHFLPSSEAATNAVSEISGLGTHTTTVSRLYNFEQGGAIIDSPGIREFSLAHMEPRVIAQGFIEINRIGEQCKFRDCKHIKEPKCAVKQAVEDGIIDSQRYRSYVQIMHSLDTNS